MARSNLVILLVLTLWLQNQTKLAFAHQKYVADACKVTLYPNLCITSLASFSDQARRDPRKWARAGVSVTIGEAKRVNQFLIDLKKAGSVKGRRSRVALLDCIELSQDALDGLHKSLGVLRNLSGEGFNTQMGDVTTWLSSAMTDGDTCLEGFGDGRRGKEEEVKVLQSKVTRMSYMTSNALALVHQLATSGP